MKQLKITTQNEKETLNFGKTFASFLKKGDIIVLSGDLGSGKTKLTEGILTYYGLETEISSPTFTIVNEYVKNDTKIFHFDVYRLEDSSEFYAIGGEEYFENGICIIEWGEIIQDALPKNHIQIRFERNEFDENIRILNILSCGENYDKILNKLEDYLENIKY